MKTTRRQILDIAADALGLSAAEIRPEASWEEYGGHSLAIVAMLLTVQEHFRITLETARRMSRPFR
jgi:acyl carrier protein